MKNKIQNLTKDEIKSGVIWITGLAGAGKTTFASELYKHLKQKHNNVILLDGDVFRSIFGESEYDIASRIKVGYKYNALAKFLEENGLLVILAAIGLFDEIHTLNVANFNHYFQVYIKCDFDEIVRRDKKGLYSGAMSGKIKNVVGVDIAYDEPKAHLVIENSKMDNLEQKLALLFSEVDKFLGCI